MMPVLVSGPSAFVRRPDGGIWGHPHRDPSRLTAEIVDTLMWPICERINRSGWLWTTESCQGHAERGLQPMLGFVTSDIGRLLEALRRADVDHASRRESEDPTGVALTLRHFKASRFPELGSVQVRITVGDVGVFSRLAELV